MILTTILNELLETNIEKQLTLTEFMKIIKMSNSTKLIVRLLTNDLTSYLRDDNDNTLEGYQLLTLIDLIDNGVGFELNAIPSNLKLGKNVKYDMVINYPQLHELIFTGYLNTGFKLLDLWKMTNEYPEFIRRLFLEYLFSQLTHGNYDNRFSNRDYHDCIEYMRHDVLTDEEQSLIKDTTNIFDYNKLVACLLVTGQLPDLILPKYQFDNESIYYKNSFDRIVNNFDREFVTNYYENFPTRNMKHINSLEMFTTILNCLEEPTDLVDYVFEYDSLQEYVVLSTDDDIVKIFDLISAHYSHDKQMMGKFLNLIDEHNRMTRFLELYFGTVSVTKHNGVLRRRYNAHTIDRLDELIKFDKSHNLLDKLDVIKTPADVLTHAFQLGHRVVLGKIMNYLFENQLISNYFETLLENKSELDKLTFVIPHEVKYVWESIAIYELFGTNPMYFNVGEKNNLPKQMANWKLYSESLMECMFNRNDLYKFITYQFDRLDNKFEIIDLVTDKIQNKNSSYYNVYKLTNLIYENEGHFSPTQLERVINIIIDDIFDIASSNTSESRKTVKIIMENFYHYLTSEKSIKFNQLLEKYGFEMDIV